LYTKGQDRFLDLAIDGAFVGQKEILGLLLGDGRTALGRTAGEIAQRRAPDALYVYTDMVVEILVLGRKEGGLDPVGNRLDRQVEPPLAGIFGHQRPVGRMDSRGHRRFIPGENLVIRQVLGQVADIDGDRACNQQAERGGNAKEITDKTNHARSSPGFGLVLDQSVRGAKCRDEAKPQAISMSLRCGQIGAAMGFGTKTLQSKPAVLSARNASAPAPGRNQQGQRPARACASAKIVTASAMDFAALSRQAGSCN